jgi:hypothetical protein
VRVGSSSDDVGTRQYCQMVRVRLAGPEGTARANQWLTPRKRSTGSNLADMGRDAVRGFRFCVEADSGAVFVERRGGQAECLRRRCGDAAGVELGACLADRT